MSKQQHANHSPEFRRDAVEQLRNGANAALLARKLGVSRKLLYQWHEQLVLESLPNDAGPTPPSQQELSSVKRIAELERLVGHRQLEVEFMKGLLDRVKERQPKPDTRSSTGQSRVDSKR